MENNLIVINEEKTKYRFIEKSSDSRDCIFLDTETGKKYFGNIFSFSSIGKYVVETEFIEEGIL